MIYPKKFTSLTKFRQLGHKDLFTQSWIYSGLMAYFGRENKFDELEFSSDVDTIFVQDWFSQNQDENPENLKYFGLINEGHPDYWFPLENWKNTTLITGHAHDVVHYANGNKSFGFDRWDFHTHNNYVDPRVHFQINTQGVEVASYDVLCLTGVPKLHRIEFYKRCADKLSNLTIVTDANQTFLPTPFTTIGLGFEEWFNKLSINRFKSYQEHAGFYDERDYIYLDHVPMKKMFNSCRVNVVLETKAYNDGKAFLTEKTWKVIASNRPFVIIGDMGSLKKLKSKGFQTFDKFCDETYDREPDLFLRIDGAIEATKQLVDACKNHSEEINKICKKNQEWFFDSKRLSNDLAVFGETCLQELYHT